MALDSDHLFLAIRIAVVVLRNSSSREIFDKAESMSNYIVMIM